MAREPFEASAAEPHAVVVVAGDPVASLVGVLAARLHVRAFYPRSLDEISILDTYCFRVPITEAEKVDIKTAILYAMGVPVKEIGARLGLEEMTLYKRRKRKQDAIYGWIEELVEREMEAVIAKRVRKIEQKADIKEQAYRKAWEVKLRALNQGLREGRKITTTEGEQITIDEPMVNAVQANVAINVVDRIEGRAIDRKAVYSLNEVITRTEVSEEDLTDLLNEVRQLTQPRALLTEATEAELVGSPSD